MERERQERPSEEPAAPQPRDESVRESDREQDTYDAFEKTPTPSNTPVRAG